MPLVWTIPPPMPPPPVSLWELIDEPVLPIQADQPGPIISPVSAEKFTETVSYL